MKLKGVKSNSKGDVLPCVLEWPSLQMGNCPSISPLYYPYKALEKGWGLLIMDLHYPQVVRAPVFDAFQGPRPALTSGARENPGI